MYPRSHHTTAIIVDQSHVRPTDRVATHFIAFLAFGAHSFNSESFVVIRWLPGSDFPFFVNTDLIYLCAQILDLIYRKGKSKPTLLNVDHMST